MGSDLHFPSNTLSTREILLLKISKLLSCRDMQVEAKSLLGSTGMSLRKQYFFPSDIGI